MASCRPSERLSLGISPKKVLSDVETMLTPAKFDPQTWAMTLRIGAMDYIQKIIALPLILCLRRLAPNVQVALLPVQGQNIKSLFEQNKLDLAIVSDHHITPDMPSTKLYDERYICAMSKTHWAVNKPLRLEEFCELPFAMLSYNDGEFRGVTDLALSSLGLTRKVMVSVNNILMLPQLLQDSDLVAVLPEKLAQTLPNMHLTTPPIEIDGFTMMMSWHERTDSDMGHKWIRELILNMVSDPMQAGMASAEHLPQLS
ncbi:MAG: LysR substrate-binding domain-containing protein [Moraxella sp.]|nr:LysR substrate-binding domain-containing protein [Moraxella sp.]